MKIGRRIIGFVLALVLCLLLCGCNWYDVMGELPSFVSPIITTTTLPSVDVPLVLLPAGYAYSLLDEAQQANYDAVVKEMYEARGQDTKVDGQYGISVTLPHPLKSEEAIQELYLAIYDDHPEFFYLTGQYGWLSIGNSYTAIRFFYIWNADERAVKAAELEAVASSLIIQTQLLSAVEKELLFHDTLIERSEYNEEAKLKEDEEADADYYIASSAYAALCTGNPICGGYSRAFQLLLSRVGIPCTSISNEDHTWTMLWLDGEAYHTDVTWDDPVEGNEGHRYWNLTDEEIRATREYPAQARKVPEATATAYNYYVMNGWYVDDVYEDTFREVILSQIENGNKDIWLKFDPDEYEDATEYLFEEQAFFEVVYELEDDELRDYWYDEVFYMETEELGIIQIYAEEEQT